MTRLRALTREYNAKRRGGCPVKAASEGRRIPSEPTAEFGTDGALIAPKENIGSTSEWPPCACGNSLPCPDYQATEAPTEGLSTRFD